MMTEWPVITVFRRVLNYVPPLVVKTSTFCNIQARNVLIDSSNTAKVADFGHARRLQKNGFFLGTQQEEVAVIDGLFFFFWLFFIICFLCAFTVNSLCLFNCGISCSGVELMVM